jgi:glycosyltransferase involved in cell wall biosynthesis
MRILLLSYRFYPDVGGIEVNSRILAAEFAQAGHDVVVATMTAANGKDDLGVRVERQPSALRLLALHLWANVVFENNPTLRLSWPLLLIPKPHVVALRTWIRRDDGGLGWPDHLKLWWIARAAAVIAVSRAVGKIHQGRVVVIGNPYRAGLFGRSKSETFLREFVFLGRLVSDKGVDLAIEAVSELGRRKSCRKLEKFSPRLTIVGDGPERPALERMVRKLGVQEHVVFTGTLSGKALTTELQSHRFLIVPSRWAEPFGNVALEGMACGCVPIVSSGGGLPDAVGDAGVVFESGQKDALVDALETLMVDPLRESRLRAAGLRHLRSHQPAEVAARYLSVLHSVSNAGFRTI